MKTLLSVIVLFTLLGCQTAVQPLYFDDSTRLDTEILSPLQLQPGIVHDDLRIDLVRNLRHQLANNHYLHDGPNPNHPLGFDLGNGLFFDLNDNLFFQLNQLMEISDQEDYLIKLSQNEGQQIRYKRRADNEICEEWPGVEDAHRVSCKRQLKGQDFSKVFVGEELLYEINTRSNEIHYRSNVKEKHNRCTIEKIGSLRYIVHKAGNQHVAQRHQNMITINGKIMLHKNPESRTMSIYTIDNGDCRLLYHLQRGKNKVILRDANYRGYMIERTTTGVKVYKDDELDFELERIS